MVRLKSLDCAKGGDKREKKENIVDLMGDL